MLADEGPALASWNTLAAATAMVQGTMNALTRRRIRTILAIGGGLAAWNLALAAAEVAPDWKQRLASDHRLVLQAGPVREAAERGLRATGAPGC